MNKAFVFILCYFALFLHSNTVRTTRSHDESPNKYVKLTRKSNVQAQNEDKVEKKKKLIKQSFLQFNILANSPPPPCVGDDDCFCKNFYDLTLILDESASIGIKNWKNYVIPFTDKIIKDLHISENEVHVGILLFSSKNRDYITFNEDARYKKDDILNKVDKLKTNYGNGSGTKILEALKYSMQNYSKHIKGRSDAPKVTILFTDGNDTRAKDTELFNMGLSYRKEHVKLLVLGVAAAKDKNLKLIAGCDKNSSCPYSMKAEWETINDITKKLTSKICHAEPEPEPETEPEPAQPNTPCQGDACFCEDYYDLTLIIDESGSITENKWKKDVIPFAEQVVNNLNISKDKVHVGIIRFSINVRTDVSYDQETRYMKKDIINVVKGLTDKYGRGSGTRIVETLEFSLKNFTKHPNSRPNAPKVTILFTDGNETSKNMKDIGNMGLLYKKENVKLIVVGVYQATLANLKLLAGCQENEYCPQVMKLSWEELTRITKVLTDKICDIDTGETPGSSESNPGSPESNPGSPESNPGSPEGNPSSPEGNPSSPEGNPSSPEGNPSSPEGNPSSPEGNPSSPEGNPSSPESNPGSPESNPSSPEGNPSSPEGNPSSPESNPGSPGSAEPEHLPCSDFKDCYCKDFYDLTFLLDESASIGDFRWSHEVVPFAKEMVRSLNVGYNTVHVGVMLFSDHSRDIVRFSDKARYEKGNLMQKIEDLKRNYKNGKKTFMVQSLDYALRYFMKISNRTKAPKITMLFTDGNDSSESDELLHHIGLLYRKEKVKLLVLGVSMANENKLKILVGCPQNNEICPFIIRAEWGQLNVMSNVFVKKICDTGSVVVPPPEVDKPEPTPSNPCSGNDCLCENIYDLTLILDESASIGYDNWKNQVFPFVVKIIDNLDVSDSKVHVGIMLFAKNMRDFVKFSDEASSNKNTLTQKVQELKSSYKAGSYTYIVEALEYGLEKYAKYIKDEKNSRLYVPKVTMLFTDGNNSKSGDTILSDVSALYKKENVKLLVIGVGRALMNNLRLLAGCHKTNGDCPSAIKTDWDNIKNISKGMVDKICDTESPIDETEAPPSISPPQCIGNECFCKDYFDLTFIGVPSTTRAKNYKSGNDFKDYAKNIINIFHIGEQHVHVALSIYLGSKSINTNFDDTKAYNKGDLLNALENGIDDWYTNNKTNITNALELGLKQSFGNGNREKAPKVAVLLTNSNNDISEQGTLKNMSKNYADKKVKLLIVALESLPKEILYIAGGCNVDTNDCPNVFITSLLSSDINNTVESFVGKNICDIDTDGTQVPPDFSCSDESCEECDDDVCDSNSICKKSLDIAIVLDQSVNISKEQWNRYVKPFATQIVKQNYLSKYRTHVTVVKMKKKVKQEWSLDKKISYKKNKIISKINKLLISHSSKKDIADNLKYLREKVFSNAPTYKRKLIIMLVEGKSNTDLNELRKEMSLLRINKIDLFVYAIDTIDEKEYQILGDCEKASTLSKCKNIIKVSWENLLSASEVEGSHICNQYPEDAECSEWGDWSPCPDNDACNINHAFSKRERKGPSYTLKEEGFLGDQYGSSCMDLSSIEYKKCPVKEECNDLCGDFGEWSPCNATCGDGIRIRRRDTSSDSDECKKFNSTELEACNVQNCDSTGTITTDVCEDIGEWGEWSSCSKTCGYSIRSRTFTILPEDIDEQHEHCKTFEKIETEVCSVPRCEDEKCFDWSEWTEWSATCGPRKRVQRAHVIVGNGNSNTRGGGGVTNANSRSIEYRKELDECEGHYYYQDKVEHDEGTPCTNNPCGDWTEWSECDRTCNVGMRIRHFVSNVLYFDGEEKDSCLEYYNKVETEPCLNLPLCDGGECNDWETWVDCKKEERSERSPSGWMPSESLSSTSLATTSSCHIPNKRILTRKLDLLKNIKNSELVSPFCNDYKLFREEECPAPSDQCIDALCNEWEEWGNCSATCGIESFRSRRRREPLELIPPSQDMNGNIGLTCEQQNIKVEETEMCDVPACASVDVGGGSNGSSGGGKDKNDANKNEGLGTGEKVSLAAGIIGLLALTAGGLIYGYNALNGGEAPHSSNMEFENVENNEGSNEQENEDFEVVDANDPMWN
ncbi:circumsporozoite-and TRAP-related protein, putative (CTRP) [Plasmodium malariae]|uniref:Circumsporozoite-and TRAP-related protein, putative (CTRP) n=1 Tax=Plasmodium malariae TaxID=5858 RepID=A0A1A8VW01_PLAMA|nr:circumsporozoite-and TRAP-related protein, putative (CTRP) [Plasmodium malariae]